MAKKETALAVVEESPPALATADDFGGGFSVEGREEKGSNLSRVAMYAGTPEEEAKYGQHKRGVFLDVLEVRELGMSINIMPVVAYATYHQWEAGQRAPVQTWMNRRDVPPDLLEWKQDATGKSIKPAVQECVNVLCVVQSVDDKGIGTTEPWPYLFQFKSTGLKAFENTINPVEARRRSTRKSPGLYQLSSIEDKNGAGQTFRRLTARPIGDPPADMVKIAKDLFDSQQKFKAAADRMQAENPDEFNPDAH